MKLPEIPAESRKKMKRGFFFDIDGTLYQNRFHEVSPAVTDALDQLLQNGDPVYLVSSRSIHETANLPEQFIQLPFTGMVLEGGALVLDQNRQPVSTRVIGREQMQKVIDFCTERNLDWRYSTLDGNYFGKEPAPDKRTIMFALYLNCPVYKEYEGEDVFNVLIWTEDPKEHAEARDLFGDFSMVEYSGALELRNPEASKEMEVGRICRKERYDQSIAFGDGNNDAEMLKQATLGVAMGNAYPLAKEAADTVCLPVSEDGVPRFLAARHWIKERPDLLENS